MCLICIDYDRERLTLKEAWINFGEMYTSMDGEHRSVVTNKLMDAAIDSDEEIDIALWHTIFQGALG
jgi:hypothetical protein